MEEKKCNKCGECCKVLGFTVNGLQNDRLKQKYYKAHGCRIEKDMVFVPMACPHLTKDNLCDIHETKPVLCKIFKWQSKREGFITPKGCAFKSK